MSDGSRGSRGGREVRVEVERRGRPGRTYRFPAHHDGDLDRGGLLERRDRGLQRLAVGRAGGVVVLLYISTSLTGVPMYVYI